MKKEQYTIEKSFKLERIRTLQEEVRELTNKYIEANKEFEIGDKVIVTGNHDTVYTGFIDGITVGYNNNIEYKFLKCKKDGTPSQHELWFWFVKEIKLWK